MAHIQKLHHLFKIYSTLQVTWEKLCHELKVIYCKDEMLSIFPIQLHTNLEALSSFSSVTGVLNSVVFTGLKLLEITEAMRLSKHFIQCVHQNLQYSL